MIEQVSNPVIFYAFFTASKQGKTGLTVTTDVYKIVPAGTITQIKTAQSATEVGDGVYSYRIAGADTTVEADYIAVFKTSDGTVDSQHIPALWAVGHAGIEDLDAAVSSRATPGDVLAAVGGGGTAQYTHTVLNGMIPLDGVAVWVTTASTSSTTGIVASGVTNSFGVVKFLLDPGVYYFWHQLRGFNFSADPTMVMVT